MDMDVEPAISSATSETAADDAGAAHICEAGCSKDVGCTEYLPDVLRQLPLETLLPHLWGALSRRERQAFRLVCKGMADIAAQDLMRQKLVVMITQDLVQLLQRRRQGARGDSVCREAAGDPAAVAEGQCVDGRDSNGAGDSQPSRSHGSSCPDAPDASLYARFPLVQDVYLVVPSVYKSLDTVAAGLLADDDAPYGTGHTNIHAVAAATESLSDADDQVQIIRQLRQREVDACTAQDRVLTLLGTSSRVTRLHIMGCIQLTHWTMQQLAAAHPALQQLDITVVSTEFQRWVIPDMFHDLMGCQHLTELNFTYHAHDDGPLEEECVHTIWGIGELYRSIAHLTQLQALRLENIYGSRNFTPEHLNPEVLGYCLGHLTNLTRLEYVELEASLGIASTPSTFLQALTSASRTTGFVNTAISQALQNLRVLHVSRHGKGQGDSNQDPFLSLLARQLPQLEVLELPGAVVRDRGYEALHGLTALTRVHLGDIDLQEVALPGSISWWQDVTFSRVLLYHLPNILPIASCQRFSADVTIVSWLCPMGQAILRVVDYMVSALLQVEEVELSLAADVSWSPLLGRLAPLHHMRRLTISPAFTRMNGDVELPHGGHLQSICTSFQSLTHLTVSHCQLGERDLLQLLQLRQLKYVKLQTASGWKGCTNRGVAELKRALGPHVQVCVEDAGDPYVAMA